MTLSRELLAELAADYPTPVVDAVVALEAADNLHERRDRIVECFRVLTRWAAAVAIAARAQYGSAPAGEPAEVVEQLRRLRRSGLTDGQWVGLTRELLRPHAAAPSGHPVPALVELFHGAPARAARRLLDGLLEMRKAETVAHGATGDSRTLADIVERREPQLAQLLARFGPIARAARPALPLAEPDGDQRQGIWLLVGATPSRARWPRGELAAEVRLPPGEPVLVDPAGRPLVALAPILLFRRPSPEAVEEVFFLDGARRGGAVYLALPSMARHLASEVWARLEPILAGGPDEPEPGETLSARRPYRGLASFEAADAPLFFGRQEQAEALANRIARHGMVTVTGPSGCGKTSLLRAGVFVQLADHAVVEVRPGPHPLRALERHLGELCAGWPGADGLAEVLATRPETIGLHLERWGRETGRRAIVWIDQAEELFTQCLDPAARDGFAAALESLGLDPDGMVRVVVSLREDFFGRMASLERLRGLYARAVEVIGTPGEAELIRIIIEPARLFGFEPEAPELVDALIKPVLGQPAALAMLQFCLDRMWDARDRAWRRLTWESYRAVGGVEGALAAHADAVVTALTPAGQRIAQDILLRLVTSDRTRAAVPRAELVAATGGDAAGEVLDHLLAARLLVAREAEQPTAGSGLIELAHEALLQHWDRLSTWLDEDRDAVRVRARVSAAARRWAEEQRRVDLLLFDQRTLGDAGALLATRPNLFAALEADYVTASLARARRVTRLKRASIAGLATLTILATVFGGVALEQRARARRSRDQAVAARDQAEARQRELLLSQARSSLRDDPTAALAWVEQAMQAGADPGRVRVLAADALHRGVAQRVVRGHTGAVLAVAVLPDGSIASAGEDGTVHLAGRALAAHAGPVIRLVGAPDGRWLASAGIDGTLRLWEVATGQTRLLASEERIRGLAFSADGIWLVAGGEQGVVRRYEVATGAAVATIPAPALPIESLPIESLALTPGGAILVGRRDGAVESWPAGAVAPRRLGAHPARVFGVASLPGGRIASVGADGIRIWATGQREASNRVLTTDAQLVAFAVGTDGVMVAGDAVGGLTRWPVEGPPDRVDLGTPCTALALAPDGATLGAGLEDGRVWLADTAGLHGRWRIGHRGEVRALAFHPDGGSLASAGADSSVRLWRLDDDLQRLTGPDGAVEVLAASRDGSSLAAAARDPRVWLWNLASGVGRGTSGHQGPVTAIAFVARGPWFASGGTDGQIRLWDPTGVAVAHTGLAGRVAQLAIAPDGDRVAAATANGVWLWDGGVTPPRRFDGHDGSVHAVAWSPDGRSIATAGADHTVRLWDVATGSNRVVTRHDSEAIFVVFAPDGRRLVSAAREPSVRLVDLATLEVRVLSGHDDLVHQADFSPDRRWLVTASRDGTARLWNLATGETRILRRHTRPVNHAIFSPDGRTVATAGADGLLALWDVASGEVRTADAGDEIRTALFVPGRGAIAAGLRDGTVRVWADDLPPAGPALRARLAAATDAEMDLATGLPTSR